MKMKRVVSVLALGLIFSIYSVFSWQFGVSQFQTPNSGVVFTFNRSNYTYTALNGGVQLEVVESNVKDVKKNLVSSGNFKETSSNTGGLRQGQGIFEEVIATFTTENFGDDWNWDTMTFYFGFVQGGNSYAFVYGKSKGVGEMSLFVYVKI
jgi:hypothetical protein